MATRTTRGEEVRTDGRVGGQATSRIAANRQVVEFVDRFMEEVTRARSSRRSLGRSRRTRLGGRASSAAPTARGTGTTRTPWPGEGRACDWCNGMIVLSLRRMLRERRESLGLEA
jgi:hypothetical protein